MRLLLALTVVALFATSARGDRKDPPPAEPGSAPGVSAEVPSFPSDMFPQESDPPFQYTDELPQLLSKLDPIWPRGMKGRGGTVLVQALIDTGGHVVRTKVVKSIRGFDRAAIRAVRGSRFKPAMAGRKPVSVWVAVPVKFTLPAKARTAAAADSLPVLVFAVKPEWPEIPTGPDPDSVTVVVTALVGVDGLVHATKVDPAQSYSGCCESAEQAVRKCRFRPAIARGKPVALWIPVPITWRRSNVLRGDH